MIDRVRQKRVSDALQWISSLLLYFFFYLWLLDTWAIELGFTAVFIAPKNHEETHLRGWLFFHLLSSTKHTRPIDMIRRRVYFTRSEAIRAEFSIVVVVVRVKLQFRLLLGQSGPPLSTGGDMSAGPPVQNDLSIEIMSP